MYIYLHTPPAGNGYIGCPTVSEVFKTREEAEDHAATVLEGLGLVLFTETDGPDYFVRDQREFSAWEDLQAKIGLPVLVQQFIKQDYAGEEEYPVVFYKLGRAS